MSYRELFSSINCHRIVFFEDDFKQAVYKKERVIYDLTRMNVGDRRLFLSEIQNKHSVLANNLQVYLEAFDKCFEEIGSWEDSIVIGDITTAFPLIGTNFPELKNQIENLYNKIDEDQLSDVYIVSAKYGIGASWPSQYDEICRDYIQLENRIKSIRIYTDYSATTARLFSDDINKSTNTKSIVCIIDNQLSGAKRADEIIQAIIDASKDERKNIIGCIFSSQEQFEVIRQDVYFEYVSKTQIENLESCLAKSAYNYYLSKLKEETLDGLTKAFESAQKSKEIAYYLSIKALKEGESEYQVINDWIHLLSVNAHIDSENKKHLISLSRVINSLEDTTDIPDNSFQLLNTLEAFDYSINKYYLPVVAGDVFVDDKDNWYVLVGQDCDMARSISRRPRNALAELLPAKVRPQTEYQKWVNDLKTASIYNFRKSITEDCKILQIDYRTRNYIANEILNLCSYNADGECRISLKQELNDEQKILLPQYMVQYYSSLQEYFSSVKTIKSLAREAFDVINNPERTRRLFSISDFALDTDTIVFKLHRVCRLTHAYVFYLYKLYLEYRGRQPFKTINLVRRDEVSLPVFTNKKSTEYYCTVQRVEDPNKSNPKYWYWIVDKTELIRVSDLLGFGRPEHSQDDIILEEEKKEIRLKNSRKRIIIEKGKDRIYFNIKNEM